MDQAYHRKVIKIRTHRTHIVWRNTPNCLLWKGNVEEKWRNIQFCPESSNSLKSWCPVWPAAVHTGSSIRAGYGWQLFWLVSAAAQTSKYIFWISPLVMSWFLYVLCERSLRKDSPIQTDLYIQVDTHIYCSWIFAKCFTKELITIGVSFPTMILPSFLSRDGQRKYIT